MQDFVAAEAVVAEVDCVVAEAFVAAGEPTPCSWR